MADNPIETAAQELKKWLEQLQKIYQLKIDEEKKAQALAKEQAKEALAAERHEEMMEELRGIREGKSEGQGKDYSAPYEDLDEDWEPPEPEVEYDYEKDVKEAREFKAKLNEMPDGDDKAQLLREKGPEARKMFDDYRKQVEARPECLGKEALLKELDDLDQMLDYEAYAQEHGLDGNELDALDGADDLDAGDMGMDAPEIGDPGEGLEQAVEGIEQAADQAGEALEQASKGVQQAAGAVAGGAGGAPAVAAPAAAPAAPAAGVEAPAAAQWKQGSVGEALKKEGYPVRRQGGPRISHQRREQKIGTHRRK